MTLAFSLSAVSFSLLFMASTVALYEAYITSPSPSTSPFFVRVFKSVIRLITPCTTALTNLAQLKIFQEWSWGFRFPRPTDTSQSKVYNLFAQHPQYQQMPVDGMSRFGAPIFCVACHFQHLLCLVLFPTWYHTMTTQHILKELRAWGLVKLSRA